MSTTIFQKRILLEAIELFLSPQEIKTLSSIFGVDFDNMQGSNQSEKISKFLDIVGNQDKLKELYDKCCEISPHANQFLLSANRDKIDDVDKPITLNELLVPVANLNVELASLHAQSRELTQDYTLNKELDERLKKLADTALRALGQGKELTARVVLPRPEAMDVQLVPSTLLDRLEEYNSDLNWSFLIMGSLFGGVTGILVNWATNPDFVITRISIVLISIFFVLALFSTFWTIRLRRRTTQLKEKIFKNISDNKLLVANLDRNSDSSSSSQKNETKT